MPDGLYCLNDVSTMLHFDSTISLHAKAFLTRLPAASAILGTVIGCHPASCLGRGSGIAFKCLLIRVRATSKVLPKMRITHCAQCWVTLSSVCPVCPCVELLSAVAFQVSVQTFLEALAGKLQTLQDELLFFLGAKGVLFVVRVVPTEI